MASAKLVMASISTVLEILGCLMPFAAFGVTQDWAKTFDCFGPSALATDLGTYATRLEALIVMTGLKRDVCILIADSIGLGCFQITASAISMMVYVSHKSQHGAHHPLINWIWPTILSLLGVMGIIMGLFLKPPETGNDKAVYLLLLASMCFQGVLVISALCAAIQMGTRIIYGWVRICEVLATIKASWKSMLESYLGPRAPPANA